MYKLFFIAVTHISVNPGILLTSAVAPDYRFGLDIALKRIMRYLYLGFNVMMAINVCMFIARVAEVLLAVWNNNQWK